MKTLTVSGQTYQVQDPEAVRFASAQQLTPEQQTQARKNLGVFGGIETVDRLCPAFSESGAAVTCRPVEGYPLTVTAQHEATQITRCGKNMANISRMANNCTTVHDGVARVEFLPNTARLSNPIPVYAPKGSAITLSARLVDYSEPKSTYAVGGIYAITKNGTYHSAHAKSVGADGYIKLSISDLTDDIVKLQMYVGQYEEAGSYIVLDNIQLEIGTKRTACEPYNGDVFTPGEQIPALPGVNTLYADSGEITVTGRADPVAVMENLSNAIVALGGNV